MYISNPHEALKARLHERGSSFAAIAKELGVSRSAVSHAAKQKKKHKSERILRALAHHAGLDLEELRSRTDEVQKTTVEKETDMPT